MPENYNKNSRYGCARRRHRGWQKKIINLGVADQVEEGVRKAIAAAAEAGIARDALLAREGALEAEINALQQRQLALDSELLIGSEARAGAASLQAALAAASNEAAGLRGQVCSSGIPMHHP